MSLYDILNSSDLELDAPSTKSKGTKVAPKAAPKAAAPKTEAKPAAPKTDSKPAAPKTETKPAAPKAETKPAAPKAEAKPAAPKTDAKSAAPKTETKPAASVTETKDQNTDRPRGPRPDGDRPRGPRTDGDRPRGPRTDGDRPRGPRPDGDRPRGPRTDGDRPRGPRPDGDRPRGPRTDAPAADGSLTTNAPIQERRERRQHDNNDHTRTVRVNKDGNPVKRNYDRKSNPELTHQTPKHSGRAGKEDEIKESLQAENETVEKDVETETQTETEPTTETTAAPVEPAEPPVKTYEEYLKTKSSNLHHAELPKKRAPGEGEDTGKWNNYSKELKKESEGLFPVAKKNNEKKTDDKKTEDKKVPAKKVLPVEKVLAINSEEKRNRRNQHQYQQQQPNSVSFDEQAFPALK